MKMDTKKLYSEEGERRCSDTRNLGGYQLSGNILSFDQKVSMKRPPLIPRSQMGKRTQTNESGKTGPRVRSASTGRDKKSELQSRYWALLFGNLQNAINEIYQTVECYENLSSCQEAILVLENYIRDFKALAEWFKVSWDYEATPPPQRPQSLAWEVRKSNPTPRIRAKSLTSPALSGKSSPSFSGKNSPCHTIEENVANGKGSTKVDGGDVTATPQIPLIQIKEIPEDVDNNQKKTTSSSQTEVPTLPQVIAKTSLASATFVLKLEVAAQTDLDDDNLTLAEYLAKYKTVIEVPPSISVSALEVTESKKIENSLLNPISGDTSEIQVVKSVSPKTVESTKKVLDSPKVSMPPKYSSVLNRPSTAPTTTTIHSAPKPTTTSRTMTRVSTITGTRSTAPTKRPAQPPPPTPKTHCTGPNRFKNSSTTRPTSTPQHYNKPQQLDVKAGGSFSGGVGSTRGRNGGGGGNSVPSNVANRLSARSKTMIEIEPKKNNFSNRSGGCGEFSGLSSRKSSCNSSCSTLIASNERLSRQSTKESRRSEPKTMPSTENVSNDGWLTVKTRRRSSLHWANRFNQPTGYASLPTLSLLNENDEVVQENVVTESKTSSPPLLPKKESTKVGNGNNRKQVKVEKKPIAERPPPKTDRKINSAPPNVLRQKSDLTGLKLKSLRKEYLKSEQSKKPAAVMIVAPPSTVHKKSSIDNVDDEHDDDDGDEEDDFEEDVNEKLVDMKIQTSSMFSQTINDLYSMCQTTDSDNSRAQIVLSSSVNGSVSELVSQTDPNLLLSSCDELEEHDAENDEDQRKLLEEQESLERQIRELENAEIDVDTETDETDCEVTIDLEDSIADSSEMMADDMILESDEHMSLEMRYQSFLSDMSIVERDATLATLQALVARHPGRAQELHQKLSSPSRRRSLHETLKKYQAKQARAHEKRLHLQKEKAFKIQQLLTRVEDVKAAKQQLIEEKRHRMEERLQRAAENRNQYLRDKIRKAHDEEEKLREIAFIKNLEAQNKRLDLIESFKETEVRLQDLEQERQKKVEEKAAKEAAVERRRQELEKDRQRRLEKMRETRREREKRIGKMQEEKEKERQAVAREKARGREERLQAKQAQEMAITQELQRKIIQKQQESARRHEENIEHIRQRALELSIPSRNVDENGQRVLSNDRNGEAISDLSSTVSDVSREFSKAAKKKLKKLKQRMSMLADEYLGELQELPAHIRKDSQVPKLLNTVVKGGGPQGMERPLGQLLRLVAKAQINDFQCVWLLNGLETIMGVIKAGMEENSEISKRAVLLAVQLYRNCCSLCPQIARHAILGNTVSSLLDCLLLSLQSPEEKTPLHPVELSTELILACTVVLSPTNSLKTHPKVIERLPDIISYSVMIGLVDVLTLRCRKIREPIENHQGVVLSVLATLGLLTKFAEVCPAGSTSTNDPTRLLSTVKNTELFGTITLLYSTIVPIGECLPPRTISLAAATLNLLVTLATLDIVTFQDVLSDETISLKFLDVSSILLKYCGPKSSEKGETQAVIVDLIATLGMFCVNRREHQNLLTSEQSTIIKSLTKLPKEFNIVIYPALVTIVHDNKESRNVISKDFDVELLDEYKKSELAKKNPLVSKLKL